jgi:hypothetical protein
MYDCDCGAKNVKNSTHASWCRVLQKEEVIPDTTFELAMPFICCSVCEVRALNPIRLKNEYYCDSCWDKKSQELMAGVNEKIKEITAREQDNMEITAVDSKSFQEFVERRRLEKLPFVVSDVRMKELLEIEEKYSDLEMQAMQLCDDNEVEFGEEVGRGPIDALLIHYMKLLIEKSHSK